LIDIGVGVRWLKEQAGVEQVVILGNSGGGSLMGAYQSQAVEPNITATPGLKLPNAVNELIAADLYVSLCSHAGRPEVLTAWMDPSVTDERDPTLVDPSLNMYDPANGPTVFSRVRRALSRGAGGAQPPHHRLGVVAARSAEEGRPVRSRVHPAAHVGRSAPHGRRARSFGSARRCLLRGRSESRQLLAARHRLTNTLRTWLSMWSLRHSQCRGAPHLARIKVPALVIQSMGDTGVFPSDARGIHDALAGTDKTLEFIIGDHYLENPKNARDDVADLIDAWVAKRS
jgi:pimeloyl-ACP methyl ester carboxylesterase